MSRPFMRRLSIQIQRVRSDKAIGQIEQLIHSLYAQKTAQEIQISVDFSVDENYCNVNVDSQEAENLWRKLVELMRENSSEFEWVKKRWIVVIQGRSNWDDYLLLSHFDASVKLDGATSF